MKLSTQVKAVHEENETRTHDDSPSSNKVGKIVKFDNRPDLVFALEGEIQVLGSLLTKLKLSTQVKTNPWTTPANNWNTPANPWNTLTRPRWGRPQPWV